MGSVERIRTPLTEQGIADALLEGHRRVLGEPSRERLAVAWAHIALENRRGESLYNNNFGNITAGHAFNGDFYVVTTKEQIEPGVWKPMALRYPAHETPEDGAEAYWLLFVKGLGRYALVLNFFDVGDGYGAAQALHTFHYFTADVEPYARSMRSLTAEWLARAP